MVVEMLEEGKNSIGVPIYKIGDKRKLENYEAISLLNISYKLYSKKFELKIERTKSKFLLECQNGFRKGRSCIDPLFRMKLLIKNRRVFNL
jgi:hypothetical protein